MTAFDTRLEEVEYVELSEPGVFFDEGGAEKVNGRSMAQIIAQAKESVYAIRLFKVLEGTAELGGQRHRVRSEAYGHSPRYYLGGEVYTLQEVAQMPDSRTLQANMRSNDWHLVIQARTGNWQPFTDDDRRLEVEKLKTN